MLLKTISLASLLLVVPSVFGYQFTVTNQAGKSVQLYNNCNARLCACLANTQSHTICGNNGGTIKVFSTSDCSGNFATVASNGCINNAEWVNSISTGPATGSSTMCGKCVNFFTTSSTCSCP
ncbi:hypothetical protein DM01DRAFT_1408152 [Hesseltinella vesiculosa]|uniref:Uncharacterized protein n=1 Tax=Hesseltinella vesiculosa TaxID=101127 RepID=A0A1X2GFV8_9FUNG|nr:hypothetical protein DM01DRAFT_1408152 [Hesseltinella vesiculosa]